MRNSEFNVKLNIQNSPDKKAILNFFSSIILYKLKEINQKKIKFFLLYIIKKFI